MEVKIYNKFGSENNPVYATENSAGLDLCARLDSDNIIIRPMQRVLIPTGLFIEIPEGYEAHVRPRSGLALKYGITVLNTPGTIDADYRGEIGIILINLSNYPYVIKNGERVAQLVFNKYERANLFSVENLDELSKTERSSGGYGHTGK